MTMAQQSIITQVTRDNESYQPAPAPDRGTLNSPVTASARGSGLARRQKKPEKFGNTWCVCNWLFACFRKDDPQIASTTFQNEVPQPPEGPQPNKFLLPPRKPEDEARKCMIIDLDETLVHSSFKPVSNADFVVPVEIDNVIHQVYVLKRPHCDEFLRRMGEMFECILFTASLSKYADPVSDLLDKHHSLSGRLFREHCVLHRGNYVKDLSKLGRDLKRVVIIDNSPQSYVFHPDNAVPVTSWFDDPKDTELLDLIPFFEALDKVDNVLTILGHPQPPFQNILCVNNGTPPS